MSSYSTPFESLGDRRFQHFAQSLLSYEYPDLQALPVGQPDGGRDAISRRGPKGLIVFQVKFVERLDYRSNITQWVTKIIAAERQKIDRLIAGGAQEYILVTNAPGSAHPEAGGIDLGQRALDDLLDIPAQILWRTDLEVRLAKHRNLKWQYRELLTGADVIDQLISHGMAEDQQRRTDAIRAALGTQYDADQTVRFKQVDLQNDLVDLFVDVPLERGDRKTGTTRRRQTLGRRGVTWSAEDPRTLVDLREAVEPRGAAAVLLEQPFCPGLTRVVVEGAPGQGKSTLAQFICQVQRMRLLSKHNDLARLPDVYSDAVTRLPFKIDLRELATFFRREDPFASVRDWPGLQDDWPRSLVGFLAAQVRRYSGGARFDVSDLLAVARTGPLLLVLDGLDEVAEIGDRKQVVELVEAGLAALDEVAMSLQVVVTTRPPAFANSPGFSYATYTYTGLASLGTELILDYATRWGRARRLREGEEAEVLSILTAKLDMSHMRDLARNPMQLAILLSLINTKGDSLPDKRTLLYQAYMDLFFDREAAKSGVVRTHRDLLYELHGYLAWQLHADAERSAEKGSIALGELETVVKTYVQSQGADTGIADELFRGVVERIVALVATRQERFEFEVQPLREFFAAYHLYVTAQVSRLGAIRPGTRADRFDALARNAFWLNVARFYAGFYTSGELASLADGLETLASAPDFRNTDHIWILCAMLLADWSFALDSRSRSRVVAIVLAGLGRRHRMESRGEVFRLPQGSGAEEVRAACLRLIGTAGLSADRRAAAFDVLSRHIVPVDFLTEWIQFTRDSTGRIRTEWLQLGCRNRMLEKLSPQKLIELAVSDADVEEFDARAAIAIDGGHAAAVEQSAVLLRPYIKRMLSLASPTLMRTGNSSSVLSIYAQALIGGLSGFDPGMMVSWMGPCTRDLRRGAIGSGGDELTACWRVAERILAAFEDDRVDRDSGFWSDIVEILRRQESDAWVARVICVTVTSHTDGIVRRRDSRLADEEVPLLERIMQARAHAGARYERWWMRQYETANSDVQRQTVALCAMLWTTGRTFENLLPLAAEIVNNASESAYLQIWHGVAAGFRPRRIVCSARELRALTPRMALLLYEMALEGDGKALWDAVLRRYQGSDDEVARQCAGIAVEQAGTADEFAGAIRRVVRCGGPSWDAMPRRLPVTVARTVMRAPAKYPLWIVQAAEEQLRPGATRSVGAVARRDKWFAAPLVRVD